MIIRRMEQQREQQIINSLHLLSPFEGSRQASAIPADGSSVSFCAIVVCSSCQAACRRDRSLAGADGFKLVSPSA